MPLLPFSGQFSSTWSLKSSNLRVERRFAPFTSFTSSPSLATQWLFAGLPIGSHPARSLPLNSASGSLQAVGAGRSSLGARTPVICPAAVSPRLMDPVSLSPFADSSHVLAGPRPPPSVSNRRQAPQFPPP